jgi:putative membrane protein
MLRTFTLAAALAALPLSGPALAQSSGPSDAQIFHIARTAGTIDVVAGQQALKKTRNKQVRALAETLVRDHGAVNKQLLVLSRKLEVAPRSNPTSIELKQDADAKLASYAKLSGPAFDRAFVDNEVAYHKTALTAIEGTLIPSATDPRLKSLLQSADALFTEHLQHAEAVAREIP